MNDRERPRMGENGHIWIWAVNKSIKKESFAARWILIYNTYRLRRKYTVFSSNIQLVSPIYSNRWNVQILTDD